jgi:hypothetical protein
MTIREGKYLPSHLVKLKWRGLILREFDYGIKSQIYRGLSPTAFLAFMYCIFPVNLIVFYLERRIYSWGGILGLMQIFLKIRPI